jgi:hypothetical protein
MGLPPTQQLLSIGSHWSPAMELQDDSTKSVLSSPNIKIEVVTERLPSRHCKHLIQTCNPDTTSFSNFRSRSQTTFFDSWNSGLSISFSRSTRDDNTLIPRLHPEALQQTEQRKGSPANFQHADPVWTVVVAHASGRSSVALAHTTFFDPSQLVLTEKFFSDARLRSWVVVRNSTAESDLWIPFGRR